MDIGSICVDFFRLSWTENSKYSEQYQQKLPQTAVVCRYYHTCTNDVCMYILLYRKLKNSTFSTSQPITTLSLVAWPPRVSHTYHTYRTGTYSRNLRSMLCLGSELLCLNGKRVCFRNTSSCCCWGYYSAFFKHLGGHNSSRLEDMIEPANPKDENNRTTNNAAAAAVSRLHTLDKLDV